MGIHVHESRASGLLENLTRSKVKKREKKRVNKKQGPERMGTRDEHGERDLGIGNWELGIMGNGKKFREPRSAMVWPTWGTRTFGCKKIGGKRIIWIIWIQRERVRK